MLDKIKKRGYSLIERMSITRFRKRHFHSLRLQRGFTLIELLVVIALIGVLAGVILVVIDPLEQFARARDAGRKTATRQLAGALQAYYVSHNAVYPAKVDASGTTWMQAITNSGELKTAPSTTNNYSASGKSPCSADYYCYFEANSAGSGNRQEVLVWVRMESKSENSQCPLPADTSANKATKINAYFIFNSKQSKTGIICTNNPTDGTATSIGWDDPIK